MSEQGVNIWGVVGGVLGIILALIPFALWFLNSQMPSKNLRALDARLQETEQLLSSAVAEGLVAEEEFRLLMWTTKYHIDQLRAHGYNINSWKDEYHSWKKGLTKRAIVLYHGLNKIRATIAQSSSERRAKLGKAGKVIEFVLSSSQQGAGIIPSVEQALAQPPSSALSSNPAAMQCASDPTSQSGSIANIVCLSAEPSKTRAITRPSPKVNCSVADTDRVCERVDLAHEFALSSPQRATQGTGIIPSVEQALAQPPSSALSSDPAAMQCASDSTSQSGSIANILCQSAEPSKTRAYTRPSPKVNCSLADTDRVCERIDLAHDARKKRRLSQRALLMRWGKTFSTPHASHLPHNPSISSKHTPAKPSRLKAFSRLLSRADTSTLPYTSGDAKDRPHTVAMILAGELWEDYDGDDESD